MLQKTCIRKLVKFSLLSLSKEQKINSVPALLFFFFDSEIQIKFLKPVFLVKCHVLCAVHFVWLIAVRVLVYVLGAPGNACESHSCLAFTLKCWG